MAHSESVRAFEAFCIKCLRATHEQILQMTSVISLHIAKLSIFISRSSMTCGLCENNMNYIQVIKHMAKCYFKITLIWIVAFMNLKLLRLTIRPQWRTQSLSGPSKFCLYIKCNDQGQCISKICKF